MRFLRVLLSSLVFLPVMAFADMWTDIQNEIRNTYEERTLYLRETFNSSPKVYCQDGESICWYVHDRSRLFPVPKREPVSQEKVEFPNWGEVKVIFKHQYLGKGEILFCLADVKPEKMLETFHKVFGYAFAAAAEDDFEPFVGNSESKMVHFVGCNHLSPPGNRVSFKTVEAATEQGYEKCSLCFNNIPRMPDYDFEMLIGREVAAKVRYYYSVNGDDEVNKRVQTIGNQVLQNWPTPLRGYTYGFQVLNSDVCNAFACPGGAIFITTGLLNTFESDEEIEATLAHEITHVERRHGLRQYKKAQSRAFWAGLASIAAGAAVSAKTKDVTTGYVVADFIATISALATQIALAGYSRDNERESDFYAIAYLKKKNDNVAMAKLLRKLQYSSNLRGILDRDESTSSSTKSSLSGWADTGNNGNAMNTFATHPDIGERIKTALNAQFQIFPEDCLFTGYNDAGEVMAQARIESQCLSEGKLKLFITIQTTAAMLKEQKIKSGKLFFGGREYKLDNKEDTVVYPNDEVGCTFEAEVSEMVPGIEGITLVFGDVKKWEK